MSQQLSPFLEGKYGWNYGENNWNGGMDENILKFSFMFDRNIDTIVASLPPAVDGEAHYLTTDNRIYFAVGTTYYSTPVPKWFTIVVRSTGQIHQFNGTSLVQIDTPAQIETRLDAVEVTVASLGTAAFEDIEFFATQANLDVAEANAAAYTDDLRNDLGDNVDLLQGAYLVGRAIRHINSLADLRAEIGRYDGDAVFLNGRTSDSQLGSGNFRWIDASASADNDGTVIGADASGRWHRCCIDGRVEAEWFGVGTAGLDYTTNLQAAIDYASVSVAGSQGMSVYLPRGTIGITATINLPNRVAVVGANGRGTTIHPLAGFVDSYMFHSVNGVSSMFGSRLEDMHIDARGYNMTAVVYSQAWQETCGMTRVLIQYDGTTNFGFLYENGYGGAALLKFRDVEIFSDSTAATRDAIRINQVSLVGGFLFIIENSTLAGSSANPLTRGINMVNDSVLVDSLHVENCNVAVLSQGAGNLDAEMITGSANAVTDLVAIGSGFTGKVNIRSMLPNGATGNIFTNAVTGQNIAASGQRVAAHVYPVPGFNVHVSAQIPNVTGNGTEYTILFDTERFDLANNYNPATGIFTAPESGKYQFNCAVKLTPGATTTTCVIKIVTTAKEYYVYRGDIDTIRDASGTITLCGGVLADLAAGATARVRIIVSGVGADTVDVEATETWFTGYKLGW